MPNPTCIEKCRSSWLVIGIGGAAEVTMGCQGNGRPLVIVLVVASAALLMYGKNALQPLSVHPWDQGGQHQERRSAKAIA